MGLGMGVHAPISQSMAFLLDFRRFNLIEFS